MHKYVSDSHKIKLVDSISNKITDLCPELQVLLETMRVSFASDLHITPGFNSIESIHAVFNEFISDILQTDKSKLESDIDKMNDWSSIILHIKSSIIKLNFIFNKEELPTYIKQIAIVCHATNTFCHLFPFNYDKLQMNICLDQNERSADVPNHIIIPTDKIIYLQKNSTAFNVSGVTYPKRRIINLTRKEELIKLLFHEMIHFVGLDHVLTQVNFKNNWACGELNLSEAYTEFLSVVIYTCYESIHLSKLIMRSSTSIFKELLSMELNYSIRLTSNILKFYGFDSNTYKNFFRGTIESITPPILLFEYIFLRTILFLRLDDVMKLVGTNYKVQKNNLTNLIKIFSDDTELVQKLESDMRGKMDLSVSYLAVDLDWSLI